MLGVFKVCVREKTWIQEESQRFRRKAPGVSQGGGVVKIDVETTFIESTFAVNGMMFHRSRSAVSSRNVSSDCLLSP